MYPSCSPFPFVWPPTWPPAQALSPVPSHGLNERTIKQFGNELAARSKRSRIERGYHFFRAPSPCVVAPTVVSRVHASPTAVIFLLSLMLSSLLLFLFLFYVYLFLLWFLDPVPCFYSIFLFLFVLFLLRRDWPNLPPSPGGR